MKGNIQLDEIVKQEGRRTDGYVHYSIKADRSKFSIPVIIIKGDKEGPTLLVDGCTHGDEYEGCEAILQMAKRLETASFAGTFVGVPALNVDAFANITRSSPIDGFNLNRIFPGNYDTYITHRLARTYLDRVVANVDAVITFHGGGDVLHLEPLVGYLPEGEVGKKSRAMAEAFNVKYRWRMTDLPFTGVTAQSYREMGIPCILPEIGSHCGRLHDREKNVQICYEGINNVMIHLGMLDEKAPEPVKDPMDIELHYIHSVNGGIQTLCKKENEIVKEGEVLGVIHDYFGNEIETLKAPWPGVVIGFWSVPVIRSCDWWYLYAKILDKDETK